MVTTGDYISLMQTVGVKELKARLSEYLRAVKRGETIVVTEHDVIIAELRAPRRDGDAGDDIQDTLAQLSAIGEVQRAATGRRGWRWTPRGMGLRKGTAARILNDLRRDDASE